MTKGLSLAFWADALACACTALGTGKASTAIAASAGTASQRSEFGIVNGISILRVFVVHGWYSHRRRWSKILVRAVARNVKTGEAFGWNGIRKIANWE